MRTSAGYRLTLFDRHGPDALSLLRAFSYGLMVFGLMTGVLFLETGFHWWVLPLALAAGVATGGFGLVLGGLAGGAWKHLMVDGTSTPYVEQYSYQQSLVMRGELDAALESFEAVIALEPAAVSPRLKAAELYAREKKNYQRAAELFREAQKSPSLATGDDVYVAHRLVDLYIGPLAEPGRALVELRRLIERHPNSAAAVNARQALAELKSRTNVPSV